MNIYLFSFVETVALLLGLTLFVWALVKIPGWVFCLSVVLGIFTLFVHFNR